MKNYILAFLCIILCTSTSIASTVGCGYTCYTEVRAHQEAMQFQVYTPELVYMLEKAPVIPHKTTFNTHHFVKRAPDDIKCIPTVEFSLIYSTLQGNRDYVFDFGKKDVWNAIVRDGSIIDEDHIQYKGKSLKECEWSLSSAGPKKDNLVWVPHYIYHTLTLSQYITVYSEELICVGIPNGYHSGSKEYTNTAPVPEPSTLLLFGAGIVGLAFKLRKKNERDKG